MSLVGCSNKSKCDSLNEDIIIFKMRQLRWLDDLVEGDRIGLVWRQVS